MRPRQRPRLDAALARRNDLRTQAERLAARLDHLRTDGSVAAEGPGGAALLKASAALEIAADAYAGTDPRVLGARAVVRRQHRLIDALQAVEIASRFVGAAEDAASTEVDPHASGSQVRRRA